MLIKKLKINKGYREFRDNFDLDSPSYVGWTGVEAQESRWFELLSVVDDGDSILDFGCGVAGLLKFIGDRELTYCGVDINKDYIKDAKSQYPTADISLIDSYLDIKSYTDWVLCSGVFSFETSLRDLSNTVEHLLSKSRKGIAFNLLKDLDIFDGTFSTWDKAQTTIFFISKYPNYSVWSTTDYAPENDDFTIFIKKV